MGSGVGWLAFDPTASVPLGASEGDPLAREGLSSYLSARFGKIMNGLLFGGAAVATGAALIRGTVVSRRAGRRRRRHAALVWAARWQQQLDQIARKARFERLPGETLAVFVDRLGLRDEQWKQAVAMVERSAFGHHETDDADRAHVDALLTTAPHHLAPRAAAQRRHRPLGRRRRAEHAATPNRREHPAPHE